MDLERLVLDGESVMAQSDAKSTRQIVAERQFILATRDTGYRGTVAAIAELVDNAIQAGALTVHILLNELGDRQAGHWERHVEVAVLDDGAGMDREQLWSALQFGGSSRFANRAGMGRFGMGLPNSSVSQSRRIEVYSWRSACKALFTYLDVDEVAEGRLRAIPPPERRDLPSYTQTHAGNHGTLVVWRRCDRLDFRKATTLREKLQLPLGRIYRRAIWDGLRIIVNGVKIEAVDPMFCHPATGLGGARQYGSELDYEFAAPGGGKASIRVRFTVLPVAEWSQLSVDEKRGMGIVGGAGVSFLRAGREIDTGWKLFGNKRRENYDDWWRCEIAFGPELDEEFGVTHSKQGVNPSGLLRSTLGPDLEAIARTLNGRVRDEFAQFQKHAPTPATSRASERDCLLPTGQERSRLRGTSGVTYVLRTSALACSSFFRADQRNGKLIVTLNTSHPFYQRLYAPDSALTSPDHRFGLELILLAAARADIEAGSTGDAGAIHRHREAWSDALVAFLDAQ
jgi:hypothetical protein